MKEKKKDIFWIIAMILFLVWFFATGCGSKKNLLETETKEDTEIDITDNSSIVSDITQEKQYIDTAIKEHIVTLYGLRVDTIYVDGEATLVYVSYPLEKEENRDIEISELRDYYNKRDSIRNEIEVRLKGMLELKDKKLSEVKETQKILHSAIGLLAIFGIIVTVLYIRIR